MKVFLVRHLECQRRIIDNLFHHEKRSRLPHTGKRNQLIAMQVIEIGHVASPDFQEVIEISRHQMAIKDKGQFAARGFKRGEAVRR